MRRWIVLPAALLVFLPLDTAADDPLVAVYMRQVRPISNEPGALSATRLSVELKRAGGPRPERVRELLMDSDRQTTTSWSLALIDACQHQLVRCEEFVPLLEGFVARAPERERDAAVYHAEGVRREATLQSYSRAERIQSYRSALRRGRSKLGDVELFAGDVAKRALAEGLDELIPDIRAWTATPDGSRGEGAPHWSLRILEARSSRDPAAALLDIIERFTESDLELAAHPERHLSRDESDQMDSDLQVAQWAVEAFVALNPEWGLREMKRLFAPYWTLDPCHREHQQRLLGVDVEHAAFERIAVPRKCKLRGKLVWPLIRAIGALGDRDLERRMQLLYYRLSTLGSEFAFSELLWDRVHMTELELVKQGKMTEEQMVTR